MMQYISRKEETFFGPGLGDEPLRALISLRITSDLLQFRLNYDQNEQNHPKKLSHYHVKLGDICVVFAF